LITSKFRALQVLDISNCRINGGILSAFLQAIAVPSCRVGTLKMVKVNMTSQCLMTLAEGLK
jgi:hypothetical protein